MRGTHPGGARITPGLAVRGAATGLDWARAGSANHTGAHAAVILVVPPIRVRRKSTAMA